MRPLACASAYAAMIVRDSETQSVCSPHTSAGNHLYIQLEYITLLSSAPKLTYLWFNEESSHFFESIFKRDYSGTTVPNFYTLPS